MTGLTTSVRSLSSNQSSSHQQSEQFRSQLENLQLLVNGIEEELTVTKEREERRGDENNERKEIKQQIQKLSTTHNQQYEALRFDIQHTQALFEEQATDSQQQYSQLQQRMKELQQQHQEREATSKKQFKEETRQLESKWEERFQQLSQQFQAQSHENQQLEEQNRVNQQQVEKRLLQRIESLALQYAEQELRIDTQAKLHEEEKQRLESELSDKRSSDQKWRRSVEESIRSLEQRIADRLQKVDRTIDEIADQKDEAIQVAAQSLATPRLLADGELPANLERRLKKLESSSIAAVTSTESLSTRLSSFVSQSTLSELDTSIQDLSDRLTTLESNPVATPNVDTNQLQQTLQSHLDIQLQQQSQHIDKLAAETSVMMEEISAFKAQYEQQMSQQNQFSQQQSNDQSELDAIKDQLSLLQQQQTEQFEQLQQQISQFPSDSVSNYATVPSTPARAVASPAASDLLQQIDDNNENTEIIHALTDEVSTLRNEIESREQSIQQLVVEVNHLKQHFDLYKKQQQDSLTSQLSAVESSIAELTSAASSSDASFNQRFIETQDLVEQKLIEHGKHLSTVLAEQQDKLDQLEEKIEQLTADVEEKQAETEERIQEKFTDIEGRLDKFDDSLSILSDQLSRHGSSISTVESSARGLDTYQTAITATQSSINDLAAEVERIHAKLDPLFQQTHEITDLRTAEQRQQTEIQSLQNQLQHEVIDQLIVLQSEQNKLKNSIGKYETNYGKITEEIEKINDVSLELERLQENLEKQQNQSDESQQQQQLYFDKLNAQFLSLNDSVSDLRSSRTLPPSSLSPSHRTQLSPLPLSPSLSKQSFDEILTLKEEVELLKKRLNETIQENDQYVRLINEEINGLLETTKQLEEKINTQQFNNQATQIDNSDSGIVEDLKNEVLDLKGSLEDCEKRLRRMESAAAVSVRASAVSPSVVSPSSRSMSHRRRSGELSADNSLHIPHAPSTRPTSNQPTPKSRHTRSPSEQSQSQREPVEEEEIQFSDEEEIQLSPVKSTIGSAATTPTADKLLQDRAAHQAEMEAEQERKVEKMRKDEQIKREHEDRIRQQREQADRERKQREFQEEQRHQRDEAERQRLENERRATEEERFRQEEIDRQVKERIEAERQKAEQGRKLKEEEDERQAKLHEEETLRIEEETAQLEEEERQRVAAAASKSTRPSSDVVSREASVASRYSDDFDEAEAEFDMNAVQSSSSEEELDDDAVAGKDQTTPTSKSKSKSKSKSVSIAPGVVVDSPISSRKSSRNTVPAKESSQNKQSTPDDQVGDYHEESIDVEFLVVEEDLESAADTAAESADTQVEGVGSTTATAAITSNQPAAASSTIIDRTPVKKTVAPTLSPLNEEDGTERSDQFLSPQASQQHFDTPQQHQLNSTVPQSTPFETPFRTPLSPPVYYSIEMSVGCRSLPKLGFGGNRSPNPLVALYVRTPPDRKFEFIAKSEWIENEQNPNFYRHFIGTHNINTTRTLLFRLFDVENNAVKEENRLGDAVVSIEDLFQNQDQELHFPLKHSESNTKMNSKLSQSSLVIVASFTPIDSSTLSGPVLAAMNNWSTSTPRHSSSLQSSNLSSLPRALSPPSKVDRIDQPAKTGQKTTEKKKNVKIKGIDDRHVKLVQNGVSKTRSSNEQLRTISYTN